MDRRRRLIDANKLSKDIETAIEDAPLHIQATVQQYIDGAPTVDAEPVIRCNDCRYWERFNNTSLGTCYHGIYAGSNLGTPENHFCASAARMDGGEEE